MFADSLVVIGMAALSLGTIREADGVVERTFLLCNAGEHAVTLQQGYTSCGCTTIFFAKDSSIDAGDTTTVRLRFNPRGKSGEFYETGTLVYAVSTDSSSKKAVVLSLEGTCLSSEESLAQQFPIRATDSLWLSANRFDLGVMTAGESKERGVVILHRSEMDDDGMPHDRQELVTVRLTIDAQMPKGVQHIRQAINVRHSGKDMSIPITFDVCVK